MDPQRSYIFITHNLFHIYPLADRIVLMDRGKIIGDFTEDEVSLDKLEKIIQGLAATGKLNEKDVFI